MMESCTPVKTNWLGQLNIPKVRNSCLQACLQAVAEKREYTYTDIFLHPYGTKKVYQLAEDGS